MTASRTKGPEKLAAIQSVARREKPGETEIGHDHHHAEKEDDRLIIDGLGRVPHREHAAGHHGGRAHQGDASPVDAQAGDLTESQGQVSQAEDRRYQGDRGGLRRHGRCFLRIHELIRACIKGPSRDPTSRPSARRHGRRKPDRACFNVSGTKNTTMAVAIAPSPASARNRPRYPAVRPGSWPRPGRSPSRIPGTNRRSPGPRPIASGRPSGR